MPVNIFDQIESWVLEMGQYALIDDELQMIHKFLESNSLEDEVEMCHAWAAYGEITNARYLQNYGYTWDATGLAKQQLAAGCTHTFVKPIRNFHPSLIVGIPFNKGGACV